MCWNIGTTSTSSLTNIYNPMNTPNRQDLTPTSSSISAQSYKGMFDNEFNRRSQKMTDKPPSYPLLSSRDKHETTNNFDKDSENMTREELIMTDGPKNYANNFVSPSGIVSSNTEQKYIVETLNEIPGRRESLDSDNQLANPCIFSDEKAETRVKKLRDSSKESKKKGRKLKDNKNSNKSSIIHFKKKSYHKLPISDTKTQSKRIKRKNKKSLHYRHEILQPRVEYLDKYKDKPLRREKSDNLPVNLEVSGEKSRVVETLNFNALDNWESLSMIKPNDAIKVSNLRAEKELRKESCLEVLQEGGCNDDSDISQYFMINPLSGKGSAFTSKTKNSEYTTNLATADWTMDVPEIKCDHEQLSEDSDIN